METIILRIVLIFEAQCLGNTAKICDLYKLFRNNSGPTAGKVTNTTTQHDCL